MPVVVGVRGNLLPTALLSQVQMLGGVGACGARFLDAGGGGGNWPGVSVCAHMCVRVCVCARGQACVCVLCGLEPVHL